MLTKNLRKHKCVISTLSNLSKGRPADKLRPNEEEGESLASKVRSKADEGLTDEAGGRTIVLDIEEGA